jgi:hypothetical protein
MGAKRVLQSADLWQVLKVDSQKAVKPALYEVFDVETLSDISPAEFEAWCEANGLTFLITLSRNAAAEAGL